MEPFARLSTVNDAKAKKKKKAYEGEKEKQRESRRSQQTRSFWKTNLKDPQKEGEEGRSACLK